jgi:hypothetical protein
MKIQTGSALKMYTSQISMGDILKTILKFLIKSCWMLHVAEKEQPTKQTMLSNIGISKI